MHKKIMQQACQTRHTLFSGGQDRQKLFLRYLWMLTSTSSQNLSLRLYVFQNKNLTLAIQRP
jgi:hypothetical protein